MTRDARFDEDRLERELEQHFRSDRLRNDDSDREAARQVLAMLAQPLPRQRHPLRLWPSALLDWNFAPAWPRVAALASCAILGFAIGVASPILHGPMTAQSASRSDLGTVFTEPEPLTGALP